MVENALVLVCRHLRYYLIEYQPEEQAWSHGANKGPEQKFHPDLSELELLRSDADLILSPILSQLNASKIEVLGADRRDFVQSLMRQLRDVKRW